MVGISSGNEFQVNTTTADAQRLPNIAVDAEGNYVVVWQSEEGDIKSDIVAQRYDRFGNAVGGEIKVTTNDTRFDFDPVVGMDADGNFVVTWTAEAGDDDVEVRARRFDSDGNALSDAFLVNTETENDQDTAGVAMNANGQFVITWESFGQDGDLDGIFAQVYDAAGNPVGSEIAVNNDTDDFQGNPAVGIDGSGNFVIAWSDSSGRTREVNARRFDSTGVPIGDSFLINTTVDGNQDTPDIAMTTNGEFVITWESFGQDGDRDGIFAQRYSRTGEAIGGEILVNTTTANDQQDPSVAIDADGNFLITWESNGQDGSRVGVFGQYFDNTGAKLGSEFQVNTFTEGSQNNPAVAMTPEGNAIVTWESDDQDGDGDGIFAQQFAVPASVEFSQPTFTLNEDGTVVGAEVTLTRDHDLIESEVQVSVTGGTATAGLDFTDIFPLTVTFAAGEATQTISIPVLDDAIVEDAETLDLSLTAISNAELGAQSTTTIDILDNVVEEIPPVDPAPDPAPVGLRIRGSAGNDRLRGSEGDDLIRGRAGNDRLRGLAGSDRLIGGGGSDNLKGGSGDDTLRGGGGNDRLIGQAGDDLLNGGGGNDRLKGGAGNDELIGGRGDDRLIGGGGSDIFVLKKGHGTDFIRDFNVGEDQIRLQGSLSFRDLSFDQQGNNTLIAARGETLATLRNIQATDLDRASFI